jgi:hypothetical protein
MIGFLVEKPGLFAAIASKFRRVAETRLLSAAFPYRQRYTSQL